MATQTQSLAPASCQTYGGCVDEESLVTTTDTQTKRSEKRTILDDRMDRITVLGVNLSTFVFLALQAPQIAKNFHEGAEAMQNLKWVGFVSGSMGNLLLATYFATIAEWAQVRVQAVGAVTNYFVATQVFLVGFFPPLQFWILITVITIGLIIPALFAVGCMSSNAFSTWAEMSTPIGLAALTFSITATFNDKNDLLLLMVSLLGLAIGSLLMMLKSKFATLASLTAKLGGWLATFLFMWMPLPQIYNILKEGEPAAKSLSVGFVVLLTLGNGLGSTRAFYIKEKVWFTGAFWGLIVGGWLTLALMWKAAPEQCPWQALFCYTIMLITYFVAIVVLNGIAKHESLPRQLSFLWS